MMYRTVDLDLDFDLNNVCGGEGLLFVRDGVGFASRGPLIEVAEADIRETLASITPHDSVATRGDRPGRPVAFALLPFDASMSGRFFVPRLTLAKHPDGSRTATLVTDDPSGLTDDAMGRAIDDVLTPRPPRPSSNSFTVSPLTSIETYLSAVTQARDAVRAGELAKAVIARDIQIAATSPLDVHSILLRLRASFGSSYRFCVADMIGATPELLVEVEGRTVRSRPLAGTTPRTGDVDTDRRLADELVRSTKNQLEHRVVVDMVRDTLLPHCSYLDWEAEPSIVTVANVQHLGTMVEGALTEPPADALSLARALCPTPALGGFPGREAMAFIARVEGMNRGYYGGAVGWIDSTGNGTFAVTIRCAELSSDRKTARLFAGGGIVGESDPYAELAETQAKFQAMLSAIVRP